MVVDREENKMKTEQSDVKRLRMQSGVELSVNMVTIQNIYDYDVINIIIYRDVLKKKYYTYENSLLTMGFNVKIIYDL